MVFRILAFSIFMALAGCATSSGPGYSEFCLTENGAAACTIVTSENPTPAARLAALELQFHVLQITSAELPIHTTADNVSGRRVLIGDSRATRAMGFETSLLKPQEYVIAFRPNTLVLIGRDWEDTAANRNELGRPMSCGSTLAATRHRIDYWKTVGLPERSAGEIELPGVYDEQGSCYATYDFLERFCHVRWYGPNSVSIVMPEQKTMLCAGHDVRRSPALKYRGALWSGNWPFMKGQWGPVTQQEIWLFWRRLRLGGEKWAGNHTFHRKTVQEMFTDPAYQAKGPGEGTQLCYSSPRLVEKVAQMARDYFDSKQQTPEGWKAVGDYFAIVPDDNAKFCECGKCQALIESGRDMRTGQFSGGEVSNYFFTFVNAVAREVRKTHPDKYIATLAYWDYAYPPRGFKIEPNVSIAPCLHTCMYAIHPDIRQNDMKLYRGWLQTAQAPVFLWNYYHHPMEPALIDKFKCFPNIMVHNTAGSMRMFIRDGVRGIFICGEQDMLEAYVIAKIWDAPGQDVDKIMREFFVRYFGAAAKPMEKFYRLIEEIACDPANYPEPIYRRQNSIKWKSVAWSHLGTEKRMRKLGALIKKAEQRAETGVEKQRVQQWREALWSWMEQGREAFIAEEESES